MKIGLKRDTLTPYRPLVDSHSATNLFRMQTSKKVSKVHSSKPSKYLILKKDEITGKIGNLQSVSPDRDDMSSVGSRIGSLKHSKAYHLPLQQLIALK